MVVRHVISDPGLVALYLTAYMLIALALLTIIFVAISSKKRRVTTIYLSGEPKDVIKEHVPAPGHLYWGFVKRFARRIYEYLIERMHTGNLQDWINFMASWYGLLLLLSIILGIIYVYMR